MNRKIVTRFALLATAVLVCSGSLFATNVPQEDLRDALAKSALVFKGMTQEVDPHAFDYDQDSPATRVAFRVDEVLFGETDQGELEFFIPGGFYPDGDFLYIEGSPVFEAGETYLLFIRAGEWHMTPITNWWHTAFQEMDIEGRKMLVAQDGEIVTGLSRRGFTVGRKVAESGFRHYLDKINPDGESSTLQQAAGRRPVTGRSTRSILDDTAEYAASAPDTSAVVGQLRSMIDQLAPAIRGTESGSTRSDVGIHSRPSTMGSITVEPEEFQQ